MSKDLLLEIGTEEIPAHAMPGILAQLKEHAAKEFAELRLAFESVRALGTPRRLALLVKGLAETQADISKESRGPSAKVAFDADGKPTKAAQGFARGQKIAPEDLVVKDGYVYAIVAEKGAPTAKLLPELLPRLICGLSFPNHMRWADLDFKFIRPLRWLVALFGEDIVPFGVAGVISGRTSRGHRFLGAAEFSIDRAADYEKACEAQYIIVDQERRKRMIREQLEKTARESGGQAEITEELLEEVLYLVEYPTALCGRFEEKYLQLPPEAVITPMRDHQRYFPVKDAAGKLLPLFLTVRNGGAEHLATVQHGNERVLRARLADAQFFFDEDRKKTLGQHREKLKTVVFQEGLGTVYEKSERLADLAGFIADKLGVSAADKADAIRAAELAKADLVTGLVTEFTELQGIMGREYALLDGEPANVATAIDEHYLPRFAGDKQPQSTAGRILSLADKIDNIVATFSRGLIPTGSQDPFALRRQSLGIANMIIEAQWELSLPDVIDRAMGLLHIDEGEKRGKMQQDVADFMRLRLKNVLESDGLRYDIIEAALNDVADIYAVYGRALAVRDFVESGAATQHIQAFVRVGNLAKQAGSDKIDSALFALPEEKALHAAYTETAKAAQQQIAAHDYAGAIKALTALSEPIAAFFDGVMVMDKDEQIKANRLGLLLSIDKLIKQAADFSKIVLA